MKRTQSQLKLEREHEIKNNFRLKNYFKNGIYLNKLKKCADSACQKNIDELKTPIYMGSDLVFCSKRCRTKLLSSLISNPDFYPEKFLYMDY